jgi:uncharacterized protein (TIGR02391 family)
MGLDLIQKAVGILEGFREEFGSTIEQMRDYAEKLLNACTEIEHSWSGSYAGWHSRMYFRHFERPPIHHQFSGEWGGLHGIPDGWQERDEKEVSMAIEQLVGDEFSIKEFEKNAASLHEALEDFQSEVGIVLRLLDEKEFTKELSQLESLGMFDFKVSRAKYINSNLPNTMMSRDTEALRQGMSVPAWLYYAAVGFDGRKTADNFKSYSKSLERFAKQAAARIAHALGKPGTPALSGVHKSDVEKCSTLYETGAYAEAVEKSFKIVRDKLRQLTGHEKGSDAFGKGKLHIMGAAAAHVDEDFNSAAKFLTMAIDMFRNEKSHTSDAKIEDPVRAYQYLVLSSLALSLLDGAEIKP